MDMSHTNSFAGLGQLPDAPIKVGDTWKSAVTGMAGAQIASGFTLTSVDTTGGKNVAVINQTMDGTFDPASKTPNPAGKMAGKISGTGVLRFDVDAGTMESATSQMTMAMTMAGGGPAPGTKMQMKTTVIMKRADAPTSLPAAP